MLDDIIMTYIVQAKQPVSYQEICKYLSEKSGIDIGECEDNCEGILHFLITNHQIIHREDNLYEVNEKAPSVFSPLKDGLGSTIK